MAEQGSGTESTGAEFARLLAAALIGAVVGASLGLLLAPKPGTELRSEIRERAGTAAEQAQVVQTKAKDIVETAKQRLEERRAAAPAEEEPAAEATEEA